MGLQRTSNTTRPGTNRKRRLIGASLIGTGGVVFATAMPAAANNNESSASCSGVIGKATNFHAGDTNMLILSIDGAVVFSAAFTQNIEHVADVPQDGNTHTWQAAIDSSDNRWDSTVGGTVGPCGGGPPPTLPSTTLPPTTLPDTTLPDTSLPPTTLPDTTLPPTTLPPTTLPDTSLPPTTLPDTTLPDTSLPTTTLVSPSSEVTTTTLVGDEGGSSTTTTTLVAGGGGSSTDTPGSPGGGGQLPRTGSGVGAQIALAAALICTGVALLAIGRRRPVEH